MRVCVCLRERGRESFPGCVLWMGWGGSWRDLLFSFIYRSRYCPCGLRCGQLVLRVLLEF